MQRSERSSYTTTDFNSWNETGGLELSPKFQRRNVWKTPARSYLIDTLINGMPVPPIYLRVTQNKERTRTVREVIDGQQRLRAVLDFVQEKYALSKSVRPDLGGKRFSQLSIELQNQINNYSFNCEVFQSISDEDVLAIFSRLNTYSVSLNKQELRNGKYFGLFKQTAYELAHEHLQFWRVNRIFTEDGIARMLEVETTSEIMIAMLAGQQNKKNSIDQFYAEYDETFTQRQATIDQFRKVIDVIGDAFGDDLAGTEFRRVPFFYSLSCVVAHRLFGIPKEPLASPRKRRLTKDEQSSLKDAVTYLSDKIISVKNEEPVTKEMLSFVNAGLRQADNIRPRQIRFNTLYKRAFN
jgi:hypothetical protein